MRRRIPLLTSLLGISVVCTAITRALPWTFHSSTDPVESINPRNQQIAVDEFAAEDAPDTNKPS